jgi:hypothetical protein
MSGNLIRDALGGATEHLVYDTATGHLMYDDPSLCEQLRGPCSPELRSSYVVTFASLGGDFSHLNGANTVDNTVGCQYDDAGNEIQLAHYRYAPSGPAGDEWEVYVNTGGACYMYWYKSANPTCTTVTGSYTFRSCTDSGCTDTSSCSKSASATCTVSLPTP